ncbi:hypothetical protein GCM10009780_06540 [Actinomadura alba]
MQSRGSDHVYLYACLFGLIGALAVAAFRARQGAEPTRTRERDGHPESLTATLEPAAEEYLAWLADHHWPNDEYLDLEHDWEFGLDTTGPPAERPSAEPSACPRCLRPDEDVWPCRTCARLLHSACGHGMRRRLVFPPYRTRDMQSEAVIAEWICTDCSSVVALDVDHGGADGDH